MISFNTKTFKSLEFYVAVTATVAAWLGTLVGQVGTRWAVIVTALSASLYALSRGLAKLNTDTKDFWQTTEFWGLVIGTAVTIVGDWSDTIGTTLSRQLLGILALATMLMQGLRKTPALAAGDPVLDGDLFVGTPVDLAPPAEGDDSVVAGQVAPADPTTVEPVPPDPPPPPPPPPQAPEGMRDRQPPNEPPGKPRGR